MNVAVPFPETQPPGYQWLDDEPEFRPRVHLQLEAPAFTTSLREFGYDVDLIAPTATEIAVSAPFRVLSDEGADALIDSARRLRPYARRAGDRIEHTVRGGCYRSRFLRDLCLDASLTELMSEVYGTEVAPHTMPLHLGQLNYESSNVHEAVDTWHHDTIPLDFSMMVTDPAQLPGGHFEYFLGTKSEAAEFAERGARPPAERVVAPEFPGPGYAIALHGDMVVQRGAPLTTQAERITMVNAYVALDRTKADQSRSLDLIGVDDESHLYTEWVRHVAWRGEGRLAALVESTGFGLDREQAIEALQAAVADVTRAIDDMRAGPRDAEHDLH